MIVNLWMLIRSGSRGAADGLDGEKKFITCEVRCGCHPTAGGGPTLDRGGQSEGQRRDHFGDSGGDTTQRTTHTDTFNL